MRATRRELLLSAAATGTAAALPGTVFGATAPAPSTGPVADPDLAKLLDGFVNEMLVESPETATSLGLDNGARAPLKSRLSDYSWAAKQRRLAAYADRKRRLAAIDRARLSGPDATLYDTVLYHEDLGAAAAQFGYGDNAADGANPYVVSQQNGSVSQVPEFLNSQHGIATKADADAYIARLALFPAALDAETDRIKRDAAAGVIPPVFILRTTLRQLRLLRGQPGEGATLVSSLTDRVHAKGIAGDYATPAVSLVIDKIYPALERQINEVVAIYPKATKDAGVWRLPQGEAYYAWALRTGTTTERTPEDVHQLGLLQNAAIDAQMDTVLKAQGLSQGTVGQRMAALTKDARFVYPNDDKGRADLIAYLNGRIAAVRPLLPKLSRLPLKAEVTVKRVPPEIQAGAALGYMNFAALDGSRPAIYYVNLEDTGNWPRWSLPTLTAHEAIPGHGWQGAYLAERRDRVPLIKSLMGFNAFVEGWALYAEQLADETGYYKGDPFGRLGYLQAQKFRACRLVADTGLHSKRWTREQTVAWLVDNVGRAPAAMTSEVDRYCASPGQACGYKVGHTEILRLREKAKAAMGRRFDLRDFDDALVETGGVPMTVLERVVDGYIGGRRA